MRRIQSILFAWLIASGAARADIAFNLTPGVSPLSRTVYDLHMIVFLICVVIGIGVFGAMFYSMYFHRKSRGAVPANFHSHRWLEITWSIIPAIILIIIAIPATRVLLNMNNTDKDEITIKITGYQWKWHYEYLEDGVQFFSNLATPLDQINAGGTKSADYLREVDHPLVLPVHKKIRFLMTSNDVNHAWWVPDLAVKRDAISGFINEAWTIIDKPGVYHGQCAELCGVNHAFMPIVVIAMSEGGYKDWVAKQKGQATAGEAEVNKVWAMQDLMKRGDEVYHRICSACHQPNGQGLPPTFPALNGSKTVLGAIEEHINTVFNGRSGTAMQAFKNQLTDVELASVITYERNAWDNHAGTFVQPIQIKALRDGKGMAEALATKPDGVTAPATSTAPAPVSASKTAAQVQPAPVTPPPPPKALPAIKDLKSAMMRGEQVYLKTCSVCHQPNGLGMPPTFPAMKGGKIATGAVDAHIEQVLNGKKGTAMMAFKDQLTDQELADVITYERNAWGNKTGDVVTADDIKKARAAAASG